MNEFLEITAAAGKRPTVKGIAYSGGKMRLFGWSRPVVVDMAGLAIPESVPLLANHENHTLGRVGVVVAKAVDGRLEIEGEIVGELDPKQTTSRQYSTKDVLRSSGCSRDTSDTLF